MFGWRELCRWLRPKRVETRAFSHPSKGFQPSWNSCGGLQGHSFAQGGWHSQGWHLPRVPGWSCPAEQPQLRAPTGAKSRLPSTDQKETKAQSSVFFPSLSPLFLWQLIRGDKVQLCNSNLCDSPDWKQVINCYFIAVTIQAPGLGICAEKRWRLRWAKPLHYWDHFPLDVWAYFPAPRALAAALYTLHSAHNAFNF